MRTLSSHQPQHLWSAGGGEGGRAIDPGRAFLGLTVLTVGVLFFLDSLGVLDAGHAIDRWWPVAIIGFGIAELAGGARAAVGPVVVTGIGVLLLLATTDVVQGDVWSYVWPAAVIGVGAMILLRRTGVRAGAHAGSDDVVTANGVFGGPVLRPTSQQFERASLTAVFGGVTLDLRGARPAPAGATITATAAFGGIGILVPRGWRIVMRSTPIFGGVEDKTELVPDLPADAPTVRVDALALFGGVEVKHEK